MEDEYNNGYKRGRLDENNELGGEILRFAELYRKQEKYAEYHLMMDLYRKIKRYG